MILRHHEKHEEFRRHPAVMLLARRVGNLIGGWKVVGNSATYLYTATLLTIRGASPLTKSSNH